MSTTQSTEHPLITFNFLCLNHRVLHPVITLISPSEAQSALPVSNYSGLIFANRMVGKTFCSSFFFFFFWPYCEACRIELMPPAVEVQSLNHWTVKEFSALLLHIYICMYTWDSQVALVIKNLPSNARDLRDVGSIPGSGRSPGEGNGNPLQYSHLENPMDTGAWQATYIYVWNIIQP